MRRRCATLAFLVLSLSLFPARADAYIWAWLDDLSGPRFAGVVFEAQVLCSYTSTANDLDTIGALSREIRAAQDVYLLKVAATGPGRANYQQAIAHIKTAVRKIDHAGSRLNAAHKADVTGDVLDALNARHRAAENFAWAEHLQAGGADNEEKQAELKAIEQSSKRFAAFAGIGLNVSICGSKPLRRDKRFLRLDVGYGWDVKAETKEQRNRMLSVGLSYHWALAPYFTFGTGAGVTRFSTGVESGRRDFSKWYFQPTIIDFRPAALVRDANLKSPWLHVFFIRHSVIVFPGGFDAGQFGGTSAEYPTEFVSSIGVHADLAPLIRKWRKAW